MASSFPRSGSTMLAGAVDELLEGDLEALDDAELSATVIDIQRARAALDAAELRVLHEWDRRKAWAHDAATSGGAWLAARSGAAHSTARERIRVAHGTAAMAHVQRALAEGRLSWSKVRLFSALVPDAAAAAFARDEQMLVDHAQQLSAEETKVMLTRWAALADPDDAEKKDRDRHTRRGVYCSPTLDGTFGLDGTLDPETGLVFTSTLERIADQLYDDEAGPDTTFIRTPAQRRADALAEMARRADAYDLNRGRRTTPSLLILLDHDNLCAKAGIATPTGPPLSAETARRLACDAGISRVITGPNSEVLDLGREDRLFNAAQKKAMLARHQGCAFPDCDRPPGWTQAHHIGEWRKDHGDTDLINGCPLCHTHHHYVHEGGATITINPDTTLTFHRPDGSVIEPGWKTTAGWAA